MRKCEEEMWRRHQPFFNQSVRQVKGLIVALHPRTWRPQSDYFLQTIFCFGILKLTPFFPHRYRALHLRKQEKWRWSPPHGSPPSRRTKVCPNRLHNFYLLRIEGKWRWSPPQWSPPCRWQLLPTFSQSTRAFAYMDTSPSYVLVPPLTWGPSTIREW